MEQKTLIQKIENIPFAIFPTMVGAATLSNVFNSMGYTYVRHITMWIGFVIFFAGILKITVHFSTFKKEYSNTVPASLYAGLTMLLMILGSYVFPYQQVIGKGMWFIGFLVHALHICIFTYRNVIKRCSIDQFIPTWFVTYVGILVVNVVGGPMKEPEIATVMAYYGLGICLLLGVWMIIRVATKPLLPQFLHSKGIFVAPFSLALVSYLNAIETPIAPVVYVLYLGVLGALAYFMLNLKKFFSVPFNPGFAGLTFPMAIGIVASTKMAGFLESQGQETLAIMVKELSGIQIYLTTAIIGFVLLQFAMMFIKSYEVKADK